MSPYSMPLWTILTKWPAPFSPIQSQQGSPSGVLAQMAWKMGLIRGQAAGLPPGINDGPWRAPSSPPETPLPTYSRPLLSTYWVRRIVSVKWLLPPSMRTSPFSSNGNRCSMSSSTALPALTSMMILRGFFSEETNSSTVCAPKNFLPWPRPLMKSSTLEVVRLNTEMGKPLLSMFKAMFSPMTASPISPISDCGVLMEYSSLSGL